MSTIPRITITPVASVLLAVLALAPDGTAQRQIEVGASPWKLADSRTPELGELRLPDVRDLTPVDLTDFRGTPLLLIEFASW